MPRLKWFTWLGLIGAGIASWGLVWLAISARFAKHGYRVEWLTSGLESSTTVRIIGLLAVGFLAAAATEWLMRNLGRNK